MLESGLESKLRKAVKARGGLCLKWVSPGFTGVPDRIIFMPGAKILFVELKRPGLKDGRSARQKRVAQLLIDLGFKVIRADSLEEVLDEL